MPVISKKNALELQRVVKEATGRDISIGEAFGLWTHILKLLKFLWAVDDRITKPTAQNQASLFREKKKKR
jgi:hypothetical protein